jgi:UDP-glucose 6-dehydrogenase
MKIGVIGLGNIGLSFSLLCERNGFEVIGSDIRNDHIENLNLKIINSKNPLLQRNLIESTQITFTNSNVEVMKNSDFIFVFVDTTIDSNEKYNTNKVFEVISCFFDANKEDISLYNKKLIIGSTTNPGDVDQIQKKLSVFNIKVAYCPVLREEYNSNINSKDSEFILVGTEYEMLSVDIQYIFSKILRKSLTVQLMSIKTAELTKLFLSSYILLHQSFLNFVGDVLISDGDKHNINLVLKSIESFSSLEKLKFIYNIKNECNDIIQDNLNLSKYIENIKHPYNICSDIINSNGDHFEYLKSFLLKENSDKSIPFILNNSHTLNDNTNLHNSLKFKICLELLNEGYSVIIIDDNIFNNEFIPLVEKFGDMVKFYKKGVLPDGYLIKHL